MKYKVKFPVMLIVVVVFLGALLSFAFSEEEFKPVRGKDLFVPGEYIVSYTGLPLESKTIATQKAAEACQNAKMTVVKVAKFAPILRCKLKAGENLETVKAALLKNKRISAVEPNYIAWIPEPELKAQATTRQASSDKVRTTTQTNDPYLMDQWGYFNIWADITPDLLSNGPGIAIVDTGVDYDHPDLKGKVTKGLDFVNGDNDPMDDAGHGTHCAGIAAAISNNGIGIAGVSGKSKILAVKVLCSAGWGTYDDIIDGIYSAANNGSVRVISMSLGGSADIPALHNAVIYAVTTKGKLLVVAAGNSDTDILFYPAAYTEAVAVAATAIDDWKAYYSNYGNSWVDIAAPGGDFFVDSMIVSTVPFWYNAAGYDYFQGTSMACPFVAGAAARLWAANPALTNAQVRTNLLTNGDTLPSGGWPVPAPTFKRLNLYKALGLTPIVNRAFVGAYFLDALSALPLLGAKVQALQGSVVKGVDYVPSDGYSYMFIDPGSNYRFKIIKQKYPNITLPMLTDSALTFSAGDNVDMGVIPVAPAQGAWQLTVGWSSYDDFDPYLAVPYTLSPPSWWLVGYDGDSAGRMNAYPWARWLRDAYDDVIPVEAISVKKTVSGTYHFFVFNYAGVTLTNPDLNLMVAIYKGSTLVDTLYASSATVIDLPTSQFWYIGTLVGGTFHAVNTIQDSWPYALGSKAVIGINPRTPGSKPPLNPGEKKKYTLPW